MKKLLLGLGSVAAVIAPVAAVISCGDDDKATNAQGQLDQVLGDAGKITAPATITNTTVHANVMLKELPTNLSAETVELIVADIVKANLTDINLATTIEVLATKTVITRTATVEMKTYTITVAAGKATDVNAVKTAAALPASAGQAPADNSGTTDGGNNGGSTVTTAQHPVTLTLDGTQTQAQLLAAIKAATGYAKATTDGATVTVGKGTLNITFAANSEDAAITAAITAALTGNTVFAGCFEMPAASA